MKRILALLLLMPIFSFAQQEQWTTFNLSGKLDRKWSVTAEGEQRYSWQNNYTRYFHYDAGLIRSVDNHLKVGLFYRELYEIKRGTRVIEKRPHVDAFITHGKHWKWRMRLEYQMKELDRKSTRLNSSHT